MHIESLEDLIAVVETAEQRLDAGEEKARRAGDLLVRAEDLREEAKARQKEMEEQVAAGEEKMAEARQLRPLVDDETIAQAEALVERIRSEGRAEVEQLSAEAERVEAEANELAADSDVQAYLKHRDAQEQAERDARKRARNELEARLEDLEDAEEIEAIEDEAEEAGFSDLAARAREAAEAAHREAKQETERARRKAQAQARMEKKRRKRRFFRWAQRRAKAAQPGDFVFVLDFPGETMGKAVHLRPLPAKSGRIRFQVVEAWEMDGQAPEEYSDLSAQGRTWEWRSPPAGEPELSQAQAELARQLCRSRIPGWKINRENTRLAELHEPDEPEEDAAETDESGKTVLIDGDAVELDGDEDEGEDAHQAASHEAGERPEPAGQDTQKASKDDDLPVESGGLEGLSSRVQSRLRRAGLTDQQMVTDVLAAGEDVFLGLSGIGPRTLAAVEEWLNDDEVKRPTDEPEAESETDAETRESEKEGLEGLPSRAATLLRGADLETAEDVAELLAENDDVLLAVDGIGPETLETIQAWLAEKLAAGEVEVQTPDTSPSQAETPDEDEASTITVVGDGLSGQKLAQWRGAARIGLKPLTALGIEEVQLLVGRENGDVTVMAEWEGGESMISHPASGRSAQMKVIQALARQIRERE